MAQDPNDDLIQEQAARARIQRQRAAETLYGVRGGNPEAAALASRAAERLGLPTMFVQQDPTLLQSAQAERDLESLDDAPATSSFMADENNAAVAHDQVQSLSFLERQLGRPFGELLQYNIDTPINLARGIGSRALNLGTGLARTAATIGQPVVSGVRDAMRSAGLNPVEINIGTGGITVNRLADTPSGYSATEQQALRRGETATLGYVPQTTWEEVKARPIQSFIPYALEQGIVSAPDMAAVLINLPAYVAARTGEIGQTRAGNDQRQDATVGDLLAAAPAAVASAMLERLGTRGILGLDDAARALKDIPGAIAGAVLKEGLTEAGQEVVEYGGESIGTQTGFDPMVGADRALAAFVGGAGFGGAVRSVTAPLQVVTTQAGLREQAVADAERFDQIAQGVLENPLLERVPERLRQFMASATNGQDVFVPASTVTEFFQSNPDLDAYMDEWDIRDQVEAARLGGGDIAIPMSTYLTQVLPTQADAAFRQDLRLGPDAMSLREATESEAEGSSAAEEAVQTAVRAAETVQADMAPQARVYDDAFRQYRNAGYTIDAAAAHATVTATQQRVRAERNPAAFPDAYAAYTERPLSIRLELPDSVRQSRDRADVLIEAVRRGDRGPSEREMFGPSLAQFVASNGGVTDEGGDLASFGADRWHVGKPGQRRLIRAEMGSGFTADVVARRAADAGYLPEGATELELRAALEREVRGHPVYSAANEADTRAEGFGQAVSDLETTLGRLGIDPRTATNEEIKAALDRAVTSGAAEGGVFEQIPVDVAAGLQYETRLPTDPLFAQAVANTKGAEITSDGLKMSLIRNQKPEQHGAVSVRTGVFYLPEGSANARFYSKAGPGTGQYYGGPDRIKGDTLLRAPLFVKGATGGKAPQVAFDTVKGKGAYAKLERDVMHVAGGSAFLRREGLLEEAIDKLLTEYGAETDTTYEISENSKQGNQLRYALQENIIAHTVRDAGYDSVIGYSTGKNGPTISEVFDLREDAYPTPEGDYSIHHRFYQDVRGSIELGETETIIRLFQSRNLSTALHESSHLWLDQLVRDATRADAPEQVRADAEAVIQYGNATLGTSTTLEEFAAMTVEEQTPIQELFARTGEAYLLEGKAPSVGLRSAFGRFRSWLTRIYRSVKALNVPINDEIRSVFDRLLASDEEIADARAADHLNPLFADAAAAGMTTQEFERFTRKTNQAQQEQREKLDAKLMEAMRRKTTQEWKANREALREGAEREIDQQPDIAAMAYLRDNDVQMSREAVVDLYGSDAVLSLLPRGKKSLVSAEGGLHLDVLADLVGERSGEELLNRLQEFQAERVAMKQAGRGTDVRQARIEALLDKDMTELYGDPLTDGTLEREAQAAVHTRLQAELLATESNMLAKMADASGVWTVDMMQDFARRSVGQQRALKLKPWLYLKAERKAGLAAQKAFGKQDFKAALEAKLQQQVNFALYRAALDAETQVAKADALFTKIMRAKDGDTAKRRDFNMVQAARGIMTRYGLVRANQNPVEYLELLREYDPDAAATLEPYINGAVLNAQPVEEMTYDDFTDLSAVVRQLWDMSRRAKVAEIDGKRVEVAKIVAALQGDLLAKGPPRSPRGQDGAITDKEKLLDGFLGLGAFVTKVEEWATRKGRAFTDYVWSPVSTAAGEYRAARNVYLPKLLDSLNAVRADIGKPFRIDAPEIGYTFGRNRGAGLAELLGAMRHLGNESNRRKLLLGRGWGKLREDGSVDSSGFDAFMTRMQVEGKIQKKHWDYLQAEWDLHEEIKPLAQKAHRAIYGRYFAEVTADPVSTPYGTYAGGYVAAKVDPALSNAADARQAGDLLTGGRSGSFQFPGPANGFTKSRVEYNAPLDLDIRLAMSQMDEVLKFAHLGPAVHDVNRILLNREFKPVLDAYDSNAWLGLLLPWLERSVRQQTSTASRSKGGRFFDSVVQWIGRNTGMSIMFGSMLNTVQQVTGFGPAALRTGKGNMAMALGQYLTNPAGVSRAVREASTLMEDRATNQMTELTDAANAIVLNPNLYEKGVTWTVRHAYFLQHAMQNVMDPIIWIAARSKAVQMGEENPERYADSVIRTTQGSRNPEDITNFSTGPKWAAPFKAFTGYFIDQANLLDTEWQKAGSVGRKAEVYALGFFVPAVLAKVLAEAVGGRLVDDDDDGWGDELFNLLVMSQIQYSLAMIPLFGQGANLAINRFDGKMYNDRLSVAPFVSAIESTSRVPYDFYKLAQGTGDASDTTKDVLTAVSLAAGLPTPSRQAGYVADVLEGDVTPTSGLDATRGFLTGSASPGSRE